MYQTRITLLNCFMFLLAIQGVCSNPPNIQKEDLRFLSEFQIYIEKDPREVKNTETHVLALKQTIYARNLIYFPNQFLTAQLAEAAEKLYLFLSSLDNTLISALGARLLSREGILAEKTTRDFLDTIKRVALYQNNSSPTDRVVVIALLGDLGALYSDSGSPNGIPGRTVEQAQLIRDKFKEFSKHLNDGKDYFTDIVITKIKTSRGSFAVGPKKSKERKKLSDEARTGIFNYGEKADEILGIPKHERIMKTTWPVMGIDENRLDVLEPWAGHMSGSPSEVLHLWDALTGENPLDSYVTYNSLENRTHFRTDKRLAKAAGTSAFLVAMGYHSALECVEATFAYLGQDLRLARMILPGEDAGYFLNNDASTNLMSGLFKEVTRIDKVFNFSG